MSGAKSPVIRYCIALVLCRNYFFAVQENGRIIVREEKSGEVHLIAEDLIPEDMANYTCKSSNKGGLAEKNGTITVNCECW